MRLTVLLPEACVGSGIIMRDPTKTQNLRVLTLWNCTDHTTSGDSCNCKYIRSNLMNWIVSLEQT